LTDPANAPRSRPEDLSTKAVSTIPRKLGAKTLIGLALTIILMVYHWIGVRQAIDDVPQQTPATATEQLIKAVLDHNTEAVQLALTELEKKSDSRGLTVPKTALEGRLNPEQRRKLREHQAPYSLVAVSLAASDHSTAALLVEHGHWFSPPDRYLLASALAQANPEQRQRWHKLMLELAQYKDRRLQRIEGRAGRPRVDDEIIEGVLRMQPDFSPVFVEADAEQALANCDPAALGFVLAQDEKLGKAWRLDLGQTFGRLLGKDMAMLAPDESAISNMSDREAESCVEAARLLVNLPRFPTDGEDTPSPANSVGLLWVDAWAGDIGKVMNATDSRIIDNLRAGAGLGELDDAHFNLAHTQQFLEKNPPYYPYSLRLVALSMEKSASAEMLRMVLQRPMVYFFHQAFQRDARLALRNWNAHATGAHRRQLRDNLNNQLAMVYTGKAQAKELEAIRQWLADAGLSCHMTPFKGGQGFPGTAWLHFRCR
jgi:hypothetical protein